MLLSSLVIGMFLLVHEMGNAGERTVARRTEARVADAAALLHGLHGATLRTVAEARGHGGMI